MQMVSSPQYKPYIALASWEANMRYAGAWRCPEDIVPRNQMGMSYGINRSLGNIAARKPYWDPTGYHNQFWNMSKISKPSDVFLIADSNSYRIEGDSATYPTVAYRHGVRGVNLLFLDGHAENRNQPIGENWQKAPWTDVR